MDAIKNSVKTRHYRHEKKIEDGAEEKTQLVEEQKLRQEEAPTKRRATKRKQKKRRKKGKTETVAGFIDRRRRPVERTSPPAIPFSFFPFFRFLFFFFDTFSQDRSHVVVLESSNSSIDFQNSPSQRGFSWKIDRDLHNPFSIQSR